MSALQAWFPSKDPQKVWQKRIPEIDIPVVYQRGAEVLRVFRYNGAFHIPHYRFLPDHLQKSPTKLLVLCIVISYYNRNKWHFMQCFVFKKQSSRKREKGGMKTDKGDSPKLFISISN